MEEKVKALDIINQFTDDLTLRQLILEFLLSLPGNVTERKCSFQLKRLLKLADTIYESKIVLLYSLCNGYTVLYSYNSLFPHIKLDLENYLCDIEGGNLVEQ